jgi:hypothetical protein
VLLCWEVPRRMPVAVAQGRRAWVMARSSTADIHLPKPEHTCCQEVAIGTAAAAVLLNDLNVS